MRAWNGSTRAVDEETALATDFNSVDETLLRNLDRVTSLLRFNGTKDEPYKSMSRDDEFMMINTNS